MKAGEALKKCSLGSVAVQFAVSIAALSAVAGGAVEFAQGFLQHQRLQGALDSAALAGAEMYGLPDAERENAVRSMFGANYELRSSHALTLDVRFDDERTIMDASLQLPAPLLSTIGIPSLSIEAHSAARAAVTAAPCILTLDPAEKHGILLNSRSRIEADCAVHVSSDDAEALYANSYSTVAATSICLAGDHKKDAGSSLSPMPATGCATLADPLAALPAPSSVGSGCDHTDLVVNNGEARELEPGVYCKKLEISSGAKVLFKPGVYVVRDGVFKLNSGAKASGDDVLFYLTGKDSRLEFVSGSRLEIRGRYDGPYAGVAFFQDRESGPTIHEISGGSSSLIEGTVYLPASVLRLNSQGSFGAEAAWWVIIVSRLELNSDSIVMVKTDYRHSSVPLPTAIVDAASSYVHLVE